MTGRRYNHNRDGKMVDDKTYSCSEYNKLFNVTVWQIYNKRCISDIRKFVGFLKVTPKNLFRPGSSSEI